MTDDGTVARRTDALRGERPTMMHIACGHDPRRCCESCCPDEEGSNGNGGGCNICQGLAFPRVGDEMTDEQIAEFAGIHAG